MTLFAVFQVPLPADPALIPPGITMWSMSGIATEADDSQAALDKVLEGGNILVGTVYVADLTTTDTYNIQLNTSTEVVVDKESHITSVLVTTEEEVESGE
jgi:hypothetical protein